MNVYYSCTEPSNSMVIEPDSAFNEMKKTLFETPLGNFNNIEVAGGSQALLKCPAFTDKLKNTFVVRSIIDFDLISKVENGQRVYGTMNGEGGPAFEKTFMIRDANRGLLSLVPPHIWFIPDKPVIMSQLNAIYSRSSFVDNTHLIEGSYDSHRHTRGTDVSFFLKDPDKGFTLSYGDPLYYIKFDTDEKINFIPFTMTEELYAMSIGRMDTIKNRTLKVRTLDFWYKLNKSNGYPKRILDYIKRNSL